MHIYYAPYRALEKQFVSHTAALQPGPQRRVLVLCPSGRVSMRLRKLLAQKMGLFSNVYFLTFSQLLAELDQEIPQPRLPLLPGDSLHDYLLKNLLSRPALGRYPLSRGFVSAVRASLRDMADALADPDVLEEHLLTTSDPALQEQRAHGQWLLQVYRAYLQEMDRVPGYRSYRQYFDDALHQAQNSAFLHSFQEIILYGFYELTGRQLELFHALRAQYPLTVFWLYANHPAFAFGRKFFETNILGGGPAEALPEPWDELAAQAAAQALFSPQTATQTPQAIHWTAAPDPAGEVFFVAKEILRLHEQQGIALEEMAVTARTLEPYKTLLPEVFARNGIALNADFTLNFAARPLGVLILQLLSLARNGFERESVLGIVTSPYFKQKNRWRYLIDECLAQRDWTQWNDLVRSGLKHYDPAFMAWLEDCRRQLEFLTQPLPWDTLRQAAQTFLEENLDVASFQAAEQPVWAAVQKVLTEFTRYGAFAAHAQPGEFLEELLAALQQTQLHQTYPAARGVSALDALNLRGLGFQVVFVLGLNEKTFPQIIREDPVLKDDYRRVLRDQLGFWINQKMERFDEERLLFFCAVEAAQARLYAGFLQADAGGKPLVPSGYLTELARAARVDLTDPQQLCTVSDRLLQRLTQTPLPLLQERELSWVLSCEGAEPESYRQAGLLGTAEENALQAARRLSSRGELGPYDGQVSPACGAAIFTAQNRAGFSPSALQDMARCPMKYFLAKGVGLREKDEVLSRAELAPDLRGTAYHEILMDYYQKLYQDGLTGQLFDSALTQRLDEAVARHYTAQSYKQFGIYPVIWQLLLQDVRDKLADFVVQDAQHLEGYIPSIFETQFEKIYAPSPDLQIRLKGIIDRIDVNTARGTFRVLDYKSGRHGGKDLAADMFKKVILQPFIYLILAAQQPQTQGLQADGAALLNINKGYNRQELSRAGFEAVRPRAEQFIALLMNWVQQGRFFISPGEHCQYCPYTAICRKDAFRARLRAAHAPQNHALQEAKK